MIVPLRREPNNAIENIRPSNSRIYDIIMPCSIVYDHHPNRRDVSLLQRQAFGALLFRPPVSLLLLLLLSHQINEVTASDPWLVAIIFRTSNSTSQRPPEDVNGIRVDWVTSAVCVCLAYYCCPVIYISKQLLQDYLSYYSTMSDTSISRNNGVSRYILYVIAVLCYTCVRFLLYSTRAKD